MSPLVFSVSESGISICDLGCSSGRIVIEIAERFPKTQVYGVDIGEDAIELAKVAAEKKSLTNCHFRVADICSMPDDLTEKFDYVFMVEVLHNLSFAAKGLLETLKILKKGGYMSVLDINLNTKLEDNMKNPSAPLVYGFSLFYCVPTALSVQGGEGLGAAWGWEKALEMIKAAGFKEVEKVEVLGLLAHMLGRK